MLIYGLDPSYKRTGIALYDSKCDQIQFSHCGLEANADKSFEQIYQDAVKQTTQIIEEMKSMAGDRWNAKQDIIVYSECPPPQGMFSPGLYALDSVLCYRLEKDKVDRLYRLYPTFMGHVHGTRKYAKSDSVKLMYKLLLLGGFPEPTHRLSHDECEAGIFMMRGMEANGKLPQNCLGLAPNLASIKEERVF